MIRDQMMIYRKRSGTVGEAQQSAQAIGLAEIRAIAMALPQVEEGHPVRGARRSAAFKVVGKSFLGIEPGDKRITLSLPEEEGRGFAEKPPAAFEEIWREGKTFMGLRIDLSAVSADEVRTLIQMSWHHSVSVREQRKSKTFS